MHPPKHQSAAEFQRDRDHSDGRRRTFQEIGVLLDISAHTVTTHVKHIYEKLEVRSRAEAVYEALQLGILKDET